MSKTLNYSVCGICPAHCPVQVEMENGECVFVQGNMQFAGVKGALCTRGAAALSFLRDEERPRFPMIRKGARGEGKWRKATWKEALDHVAEKLTAIRNQFGGRSLLWSDHEECGSDLHQAFVNGLGSPNYCTSDSVCTSNVEHAARSLFGFGREALVLDLKNAKQVVLQTRNIMESVDVKEVNALLDGLEAGGRMTVIDSRANVAAGKADRFLLIRPGTDHALNLAVIHVLLEKKLYPEAYVQAHIKDLDRLTAYVQPYTPAFAQAETGIKAEDIIALAQDLAEAAPAVIWHPGRMTARYKDSFQVSRSAYIINVLLGAVGARGGLPLAVMPEDIGRTGLKKFTELAPFGGEKRADGVGWRYPQMDPSTGLLHLAFKAMETGEPYPIKAYIACADDPLATYPDPFALKKALDKLDLLVSMPYTWSNTAQYADVILPLSPYLEANAPLLQVNGLKPSFFRTKQCAKPRYETMAAWEIVTGLAKRLGLISLSLDSIDKIWSYQLQGTGVAIESFEEKGFVELSSKVVYRDLGQGVFQTPSGKIELVNEKWEGQGLHSLATYAKKDKPAADSFRLTVGSCAVQAPVYTRNNTLLNRQMKENVLWLNRAAAEKMGIKADDVVTLLNSRNEPMGRTKVFLTELIHPEAIYLVHGLGQPLQLEKRPAEIGLADNTLMPGGLEIWDPAGGGVALQEHFIKIQRS